MQLDSCLVSLRTEVPGGVKAKEQTFSPDTFFATGRGAGARRPSQSGTRSRGVSINAPDM